MVKWADDKQHHSIVNEQDVVANYDLLKLYLVNFGGLTMPPPGADHKVGLGNR